VSRPSQAAAATRHARRAGILAALVASLVFTTDGLAHPVRCQKARAGSTIPVARATVPMIIGLQKGNVAFMATPLRARAGSLRRENAAATRDGLSRLASGRMLTRFRRFRLLVSVPASTRTYYVSGVPGSLRVARPWTKRFIEHLAAAKRRSFGTPLRITSLTRTRAYQKALGATNGNAAPAHGRLQSTHLTGASVDISKRLLSTPEIDWLRAVLRRLTADGLVHAIEEFREPHFHVLVRKRYGASARTLASPLLGGGC
jgi:hypothetical protein